jgi:hypothetical protein
MPAVAVAPSQLCSCELCGPLTSVALQWQAAEAAPQAANGKAGSKAAAKAAKVGPACLRMVYLCAQHVPPVYARS